MMREIGYSPPRRALRSYDDLDMQLERRMSLTIPEWETPFD
jgi:hypothetical protein